MVQLHQYSLLLVGSFTSIFCCMSGARNRSVVSNFFSILWLTNYDPLVYVIVSSFIDPASVIENAHCRLLCVNISFFV